MNIPTYDISVDMFDGTGLDAISLVLDPAVDIDFLKFSKLDPSIERQLQFTDDEKRIISGIALLADTPIYRLTPDGTPYNVVFTKDTIKKLVQKYFTHNLGNSVNIEHNDGMSVSNVILYESYLIDKERGVCPNEFSNVPDGSWVVSYKVNNPDVWNKIKAGEVKGFSVQGMFNLIEHKFIKQNKSSRYMKVKEALNAIKAMLLQFDGVSTDKGELTWDGDKQLEVGDAVYLDGAIAPDGEYTADDKVFVVAEGKVAEIKDVEVPEAETEDKAKEEVKKEVKEEVKEELDEAEAEPEAEVEPEAEPEPNPLEDRIAKLEELIAKLEDRIIKLETEPVVEPVVDEFEAINKPKSSGNKTVDKYSRIFGSLR